MNPSLFDQDAHADDAESDVSRETSMEAALDGLDELEGGNYVIRFYTPSTMKPGKLAYRGWADLERFPHPHTILDFCAEEWGPDLYTLIVTREGRKGVVKKLQVEVAGAKRQATTQTKDGGTDGQMVAAMMKGFELLSQQIQSLRKNESEGDTEEKILSRMEKYRTLLAPERVDSDLTSITKTMTLLESLGLKVEREGSGGDGDAIDRVFERAAPLLEAFLSKGNQRPAAAIPVQTKPVQQQSQVQQQKQQQPVDQESMNYFSRVQKLQSVLISLIRAADQQADPSAWASVLSSDSEVAPILFEHIQSENILDSLQSFDPRISQHKQWFADLIEWLKYQFGLPSSVDDESQVLTDLDEAGTKNGNSDIEPAQQHGEIHLSGDTGRRSRDSGNAEAHGKDRAEIQKGPDDKGASSKANRKRKA